MKHSLLLILFVFVSILNAHGQIITREEGLELHKKFLNDGKSFEYLLCSVGKKYYSTDIGLIPVKREVGFAIKKEIINCSNVLNSNASFPRFR